MKPYRVLLVDDESIELEWLKRRVHAKFPSLQIVASVNNPFMALDIMQEQPVDILLTDIRMPIMSGMELADQARERNPLLQIVFISGHEDFACAKQAIALKAAAYLLKPVDNEELYTTLSQVFDRLDKQWQLERLNQRWDKAMPLLSSELIVRWLEGDKSEQVEMVAQQTLEELTNVQAEQSMHVTVALIEVDDLQWKTSHMTEEEKGSLVSSVFNELEQKCAAQQIGHYIRNESAYTAIVLAICPLAQLESFLQQMITYIAAHFPITITASIGREVRLLAQLQSSYREARQYLNNKWYVGKNRVIMQPASKADEATQPSIMSFTQLSKAIVEQMMEYQLVLMDELLTTFFNQIDIVQQKEENYYTVLHFITNLQTELQTKDHNLYELLQWKPVDISIIFQFETIYDVQSWLRRTLFSLSELIYRKKLSKPRKLMEHIDQFVMDNIGDKVTLKEVAAHVDFSPNYLGQLFKEEMGENFSNYLTKMRVKKACELLKDPKYRVYEIAELTGYKNLLYFNRQFKHIVGHTPGEYRKQLRV
ncbi:response regulator [Paenibacillus yanchengensis]|uniref:Response regulator n=1 Tax=Paenibacillus yanchengensis TaxID=2035833 RepID=A0ABW4YG71_9BACL